MQAYLFTLGFGSLEVILMRFAAVVVELLATWAAPLLMRKIGAVRAALWFINEQLVCVGIALVLYLAAALDKRAAGFSLIGGVTCSRLGLWGFDLCVQYLVQEVSALKFARTLADSLPGNSRIHSGSVLFHRDGTTKLFRTVVLCNHRRVRSTGAIQVPRHHQRRCGSSFRCPFRRIRA